MMAQNTELWDEIQRMNTAIEEMEQPDSRERYVTNWHTELRVQTIWPM